MSLAENKAIVRRFVEEVWNKGNMAVLDEIESGSGRERIQQGIAELRAAFPDLHNTIEEMIAEGEKVITRETVRGTHQGEYQGITPTGKQIIYARIAIRRIVDGKIVQRWALNDNLSLLQQLGAVPEPKQAER